MFENILFQDKIISSLKKDIEQNNLPQSILFVGPTWSGKFSTALELARSLSCKLGAEWNCECHSCTSYKHIISPYILCLGNRSFSQEIRATFETLKIEDKLSSRFLAVRAIRKLLKRFENVLWESEPKFAKAVKVAEKILDLLTSFEPDSKLPFSQKDIDTMISLCDELSDFVPKDGYNAAIIRRTTYWTHTTSSEAPKFIIMEQAEHMNEAARNALLKTLEEPPPNVYFILIARSKQGIMPTILSRTRVYHFIDRERKDQDVIERLFKRKRDEFTSLGDFFARADSESFARLVELSSLTRALFLKRIGLYKDKSVEAPPLGLVIAKSQACKELLEAFVFNLLQSLYADLKLIVLKDNSLNEIDRLQALIRLLSDTVQEALVYNRSIAGCIEKIYGSLGGLPCVVSSKER